MSKLAHRIGLVTLSVAMPALALPQALDRVPTGAAAFVGIENLREFQTEALGLATALNMQQAIQPLQLAGMMLNTQGLNRDGSAAIAFMAGPDGQLDFEAEMPPMVLVLPVSDFAAFVGQFGGQAGQGVLPLNLMNNEVFIKDLEGDYAAMSPSRALLDGFAGNSGNLAGIKSRLGNVGNRVADDSDMFFAIDVQQISGQLTQAAEGFKQQMDMMAMMMGDQAQGMDQMGSAAVDFAEMFVRDGSVAIMGLALDGDGVGMDFAAQFKQGTELANMFDAEGSARSLLNHVPGNDFLFAFAIDSSSAKVKQLFGELAEFGAAMNQGMGMGMGPMDLSKMVQSQDGMAFVMGNPPAIMMGGLFANTVQFTKTSNPAESLAQAKTMMAEMNGMAQQGMTFNTRYTDNVSTVEGVKVDGWSMTMQFDQSDPAAQQAQMGVMMIFGPAGGPSGYYAAVDNGLITTFVQSQPLMTTAINAARNGNGLGKSAEITSVSEHLGSGNIVEGYIGVRSIAQQLQGVMAMMGGGGPQMNIPADLKPLGMAASMSDGGAHTRIFVPQGVIKMAAELAAQANQGMGGDDEFEPRF